MYIIYIWNKCLTYPVTFLWYNDIELSNHGSESLHFPVVGTPAFSQAAQQRHIRVHGGHYTSVLSSQTTYMIDHTRLLTFQITYIMGVIKKKKVESDPDMRFWMCLKWVRHYFTLQASFISQMLNALFCNSLLVLTWISMYRSGRWAAHLYCNTRHNKHINFSFVMALLYSPQLDVLDLQSHGLF